MTVNKIGMESRTVTSWICLLLMAFCPLACHTEGNAGDHEACRDADVSPAEPAGACGDDEHSPFPSQRPCCDDPCLCCGPIPPSNALRLFVAASWPHGDVWLTVSPMSMTSADLALPVRIRFPHDPPPAVACLYAPLLI